MLQALVNFEIDPEVIYDRPVEEIANYRSDGRRALLSAVIGIWALNAYGDIMAKSARRNFAISGHAVRSVVL